MKAGFGFFVLAAGLIVTGRVAIAEGPDELTAFVGDWKGNSICMMANSGCHNEKVVWHIAKAPERPGWMVVRGERLENGKPVVMGALQFQWEAGSHTLTSEGEQGIWRLKQNGERLEAALVRADQAIFRRVFLTRPTPPAR